MKFLTLMLLVAVVAQGCATAPAVVAPAGAQQITWTRGYDAQPFVDQNGVCHTFSRDTPSSLQALGRQVDACFEGKLAVVNLNAATIGHTVKVARQKVAAAEIDDLFARSANESVLHAAGRSKAASVFSVRGFYVDRDGTCLMIVSEHADSETTLGHEFKHCVDGEFHDERGVWRQHRAG